MAVTGYGSNASVTLIPAGSVGPVPALKPNLVYEDLNSSVGGVSRDTSIGTSFTTVYSVTGAGLLFGFVLTLETMEDEWWIRLIVDGNEVFGSSGVSTKDLENSDRYGFNKSAGADDTFALGFDLLNNTVRWQGSLGFPLAYTTSIEIKIRYKTSSKRFRAGLAARTI